MNFRNNIIPWGILFFLLYFESVSLIGVKVSQVWKIPFYGYALIMVLKNINLFSRNLKLVFLSGMLAGIKVLLNINFYQGFLISLSEFFYTISLPLIILYFYITYKEYPEKLRILISYFSIFLILSNLPFMLNLIPQRNAVTELDKFGLEGASALNGLFHHVSSTSKILVASILFLFANLLFVKKKLYLIIYLGVLLIGVYAVYLSYTRTGWLLLLLGFIFLITYNTSIKKFFKYIPVFIIGLAVVAFLLRNNEAILTRLKGGTSYRQNEALDANVLTSYRLDIYVNALINLSNDGVPSIILGQGRQRAQQLMGTIYRTPFVAHNRFIEILQYGGVLGLLLYFWFLRCLWRLIKELKPNANDFMGKLPFALFFLFILALLPSHGFPLWADLVFGGAIVYGLLRQDSIQKNAETK